MQAVITKLLEVEVECTMLHNYYESEAAAWGSGGAFMPTA
jgi:hypothetical protein